MGIVKKVAKWLFTTPEGCVLLGGVAAGAGYFLGEALAEKQNKREIHAYKTGLDTGISLGNNGVKPEDVSVIIEKDPGVFGNYHTRVVRNDVVIKTTSDLEKPTDTGISKDSDNNIVE